MLVQSLTSLLAAKSGILGWPQDSPYFCWPGAPARDGDEEYDDEEDPNDERHQRLEDRGAVELIVQLMEWWPSSTNVGQKGCFLLSRLWGPADHSWQSDGCFAWLVWKCADQCPHVVVVAIAACSLLVVM